MNAQGTNQFLGEFRPQLAERPAPHVPILFGPPPTPASAKWRAKIQRSRFPGKCGSSMSQHSIVVFSVKPTYNSSTLARLSIDSRQHVREASHVPESSSIRETGPPREANRYEKKTLRASRYFEKCGNTPLGTLPILICTWWI
jgi:hypothetical protein